MMFTLSLSILTSLILTINLKYYFRNHDNKQNCKINNRIPLFTFHNKTSPQDLSVCLPIMEAKRNLKDLWTVPKVYHEDSDKNNKCQIL